jgi:hypothetical protein
MYPGIELRLYRYVSILAQELNFTHAALRLHVSQPTLSAQIRDLERDINMKLFERTKAGSKSFSLPPVKRSRLKLELSEMFRSPTTQVYWPPFTTWNGSYCLRSEVSGLGVYAKAKAALERAVDAQKQ